MIISMRGETHSNYQTRRSNVVYTSEWMTVYEDSVSTGDNVTSKVGMFNRIEVHDTVIVLPLFKDRSLLMVDNYRHGVGRDLLNYQVDSLLIMKFRSMSQKGIN